MLMIVFLKINPQSRINAYKALSSSSLIALSSKDPILTAFELSWELRRLSRMETEFRGDYNIMRKSTQEFATSLLDQVRTSNELEIMLNFNPTGNNWEPGERQTLERLKLAIKYKQKAVLNCIYRNVFQFNRFLTFLVRRPPECSTIAGKNLVRGLAGLSTKGNGRSNHTSCEAGVVVSLLLLGLHDGPRL